RVRSEQDKTLIKDSMPDYEILGFLPEMDEIVQADRNGTRPFNDPRNIPEAVKTITEKLMTLEK
ncbi:MAG: hypothetical protein R6T90_09610, partial [Dissulfuribacterales bacterium]